ncbi:MAG: FAD-binding protein [Deltaproteobacteria bacterium]|nr:FAD-binding protein [Deltaproteobacteria bacterium]
MQPYSGMTDEIKNVLREALGPKAVLESKERLEPFGSDGSDLFHIPELVVEVQTTAQVCKVMQLASRYRFPVTPRGLGTGRAGGAVPVRGGVVLSLAPMNRILAIEPDNMIAEVEAGVLTLDLKEAAKARGLFYPPDPASLDTCSIGGNAATNAGGPACLKYGTTRDYVLGLECVLPSGVSIRTGVKTRKGVVGYDLTRLIVGSEGTLAVITKMTLKLIAHPPSLMTLVAFYGELTTAMASIRKILMAGHVPCAMEFLDDRCLRLAGDLLPFKGIDRAGALLIIEVDGDPDMIAREIETIGVICQRGGALEVLMAPDAAKRAKLWEVRRQVSLRIEENAPFVIREDIAVPLGRITALCENLPEVEKAWNLAIYAFGHAGDGNVHILITAADTSGRQRAAEAVGAILKVVLGLGGTISGEHGIGLLKRPFLPLELGPENIRLQRDIKGLFDPQLILNPDKVFP